LSLFSLFSKKEVAGGIEGQEEKKQKEKRNEKRRKKGLREFLLPL